MSAPESRFVKACKSQPVDRTPVWFMRQAGRYMPEYRAVRKQYSLIEICKRPEVAAEVTITAAEALGVDAAIIFADLLLAARSHGIAVSFFAGRRSGDREAGSRPGGHIPPAHRSRRRSGICFRSGAAGVQALRSAPARDRFLRRAVHLASYMIEGGSSRNYVNTKKMMYSSPAAWDELMGKLVAVVAEYAAEQVRAGADVIQIFDSWVGCLSVDDYRRYVLPRTTELVKTLQKTGVPIIYFGTDSATLLPSMKETGAEVIGLDWRIPLDEGWNAVGSGAVQGNLDPVLAVCRLEGNQSQGGRDSAPRRRTARAYL